MQIVVNPIVTPSFTAVASICAGGSLSALPTSSTNNISGNWSPAIDNMNTTTYTFTPDAGQCANNASMQIVVNPIVTPTFNSVPAICAGSSISALPTTSTNSINGIWSPALNNMATTTYTFTPDSGQCANSATMQIVVNNCSGQTLSTIDSYVYTGLVRYAQSYLWEVTELDEFGDAVGVAQTKQTPLRQFRISSLPTFKYNTQYRIRVASTVGGLLGNYGNPFNVRTPLPSSTIVDACGTTIPAMDVFVYSTIVKYCPGYRFTLTNANNPTEVHTIERQLRAFRLNDIPGLLVGGSYNVTVEVKNTNGIYLPLVSPPSCQIRVPGGTGKFAPKSIENDSEFNVITYPNPFSNAFNINITSPINSDIQMKVYDMVGRLVEQKNYSVSDLRNISIGNNYQSGIYNVIISQNEFVKTVRVIKK
jgi:hypothetical protein